MANALIYTQPGTGNKGLIPNTYRSWFKEFTTLIPDYINLRLGIWWSATTALSTNTLPVGSSSFDSISPSTSTSSFGLFSSSVGGLPGSASKFFIGYLSSPDLSGGGTKYRIVDNLNHEIVNINDNNGYIGTVKDGVFDANTCMPMTNAGDRMTSDEDYAAFFGLRYEVFDFNTPSQSITISVSEHQSVTSRPTIHSLGARLKNTTWVNATNKDWTHEGSPLPLPKVIYSHNTLDFRFRFHAWGIAFLDQV